MYIYIYILYIYIISHDTISLVKTLKRFVAGDPAERRVIPPAVTPATIRFSDSSNRFDIPSMGRWTPCPKCPKIYK